MWGPYYDTEVYGKTNQMSAFQMLVYNISGNDTMADTNMVVGLDFEAEDEDGDGFTSKSTMQVGEVKPKYISSMKWATTHNIPQLPQLSCYGALHVWHQPDGKCKILRLASPR